MTRLAPVARTTAALLTGVLALGGCSTTLVDLPVPGTGVEGETITVTAEFEEALNLAEGATVKVDGVDSGRVQEVRAADFAAEVEMEVQVDAGLRTGATARLRYTTPLGELFVDVVNPVVGPELGDGARLDPDDTSTAPTVEDALSQASLLVNGGGLAQLQTLAEEGNAALGGREDTVRALLEQSETFLREANATTDDIDLALRSIVSLSRTLRERESTIDRALREIRPAARVLRENTPGLTRLLAAVEEFAGTADRTVRRTREQLLEVVRLAEPVLTEIAALDDDLGLSLTRLVEVGSAIDEIVPADYAAISLDLRLDRLPVGDVTTVLTDLLGLLGLGLDPGLLDDLPLDDLGLGDLGLGALLRTAP